MSDLVGKPEYLFSYVAAEKKTTCSIFIIDQYSIYATINRNLLQLDNTHLSSHKCPSVTLNCVLLEPD